MKKKKLAISGGVSFVISLILLIVMNNLGQSQASQTMAERWSDEGGVSHVSCFFSVNSGITEDRLLEFAHGLDSALAEASVLADEEHPDARLWVDAYSASGKVTISTDRASVSADAVGIGGDFFLFHPEKLLYGSYFSGNDLMQDYCVIDEDAAWQLFGSNDVAGKMVNIGDVPHMVTGVVERESGRLAEAAGLDSTVVYVSYSTLEKYGRNNGINHYEIVMPNPVTGYAYQYVSKQLGSDEQNVEVVENTGRYSLLNRLKLILAFGTRSMNGKAIIYPFWENIARGYEDILLALTFAWVISLLYPVLLAVIWFCVWWKRKDKTWFASKGGNIMKKGFWKKVTSLGMAVMLTISLAACGSVDGEGGSSSGNGGGGLSGLLGGGGKKDPNAALAKENVYKYDELTLPDMNADSYDVQASTVKEDMLYMVLRTYTWATETTNSSQSNVLLTMKTDGTDAKVIQLQKSGEEVNVEESPDLPEADEAEPTQEPSANDFMQTLPGGNVWEESYYSNYAIGNDGLIYAVRTYYYSDYSDPANYISINTTYVTCWNGDGTIAWEMEVPAFQTEEEWTYVSNLLVGVDGSVNLILNGDNAYSMAVTKEAAGEKKPMPEDAANILQNVANVLAQPDGNMLVLHYGMDDWTKMMATTYNPLTNEVGESIEMPASLGWSGYNSINTGAVSDLIYSTYNGVYALNLGDTESTLKMDFINSDLNITNLMSLVELDADTFMGIFQENYDGSVKAGLFTYVKPEDIPDKGVLVLGGNYIGNAIKQRVVEFNRNSETYRIVVKNYDQYNTAEDYEAGTKQLNNDIITGQMPDILITQNLPTENYISKGLLADIGAMIAADPELSQIEYVQNVFDAYKVNDKLYYIIPNFYVSTVIGKTSIVGDRTSWTMADMKELIQTLEPETEIISELTRSNFFNMAMQFCGTDFVDVETGKCEFNSPAFIELMEFAKTLPEEMGEDYYGEDYWMTYESRFRENKTILMQTGIYSLQNMNYTINGNFGEEVSFIGFPTAEGQGSYLTANASYAISARSLYPEGAWEFVRYYLTEEYQSDRGYGMPTIKSLFMEQAKEATGRPYYLDQNGNKVEYDESIWINNEEIKLDPMSQEQVDEIVNFVFSVDKTYYSNDEVRNIINEEMEAFYSGQKTAQDVAAIIQSRVQIYVDENR